MAGIIRPSTLLGFHALLKKCEYRQLFSSGRKGKPSPKGPSKDIIDAIVEMKRRISGFGIHAGDVDGVTLCRRLIVHFFQRHPATPQF